MTRAHPAADLSGSKTGAIQMRLHYLKIALVVGLASLVAACADDAPTALSPDDAQLAKGGNNKNKGGGGGPATGDIVTLGDSLFNDMNLSVNTNQACSSCHEPAEGFAAALAGVTDSGSVVQGSVPGRFGDRKPPTATYATLAPTFDGSGKGATGGNFWDGRATGALLGNPAADQALGPFINPAEQAMPDKACVVWRVATSNYIDTWVAVWDSTITQIEWPQDVATTCTTPTDTAGAFVVFADPADRETVNVAYDQVAVSIKEFETTINTFSSAFDAGQLSPEQAEGEKLFSSKGKCHQCHDTKGSAPLFTDFQFHNLGVPRNPDHPLYPYGVAAFDPGLGGVTEVASDVGKFKTPTARNVAVGSNRTFMHNGSLKTLRQVVEFYNTRDVLRTCEGDELQHPERWGPVSLGTDHYDCWPAPEYPENLDTKNMGNLGLTPDEVTAIVSFMEALSDQNP